MRIFISSLIFSLPLIVVAAPGLDASAITDTVIKVKYIGDDSTNTTHPALTVQGKILGIGVKANNSSSAKAIVGQVNSYTLPTSGMRKVGVMGAGDDGVMGKGHRGVSGEGDTGVYGMSTVSVGAGVFGEAIGTNGVGVKANGLKYGVFTQALNYGAYGVWSEGGTVGIRGEAPYFGLEGYSPYIGLMARATDGGGIGVYGAADVGESIGVYGGASGEGGIGVKGEANGEGGYAGFFDGNVVVTGECDPCEPSDEMFKTDIQELRGAVSKVMGLRPKTYSMKRQEFRDKIRLPEGKRFGFIAQELQTVFPEMVHEAKIPTRSIKQDTVNREDTVNRAKISPFIFKVANYNDLIPILVSAIQEQQAMIEKMRAELEALKR